MPGSESEVDLGFLDNSTPPLKLSSRFFPSKLGGRPAWLCLEGIPGLPELECSVCQKPTVFLLQIYAPIESKDSCFHRTLLVFSCLDPACFQPAISSATPHPSSPPTNSHSPPPTSPSVQPFVVLRSQLPRVNDYYSSEPSRDEGNPALDINHSPNLFGIQLCHLCGCRSDKKCSACRSVWYCSAQHQKTDWKYHKAVCKQLQDKGEEEGSKGDVDLSSSSNYACLFGPEREIVIEDEELPPAQSEDQRSSDQALMAQLRQQGALDEDSTLDDELRDVETILPKEDKAFASFRERVSIDPDQVIRYERGGQPLHITTATGSADSIPPCHLCGSQRQFEFQLMPQLLSEVSRSLASLGASRELPDWGTVLVYTCSESCEVNGYAREHSVNEYIT